MFGIGIQELVVIFFIALLIFGASRLPEVARGLGKAIREFKKVSKETEDDFEGKTKDESNKK